MSYAAAAALQTAVYARLTGWPALAGVTVVDAVAPGSGTGKFILLGPETAADQSDKSGPGAEHRFQVSVISDDTGFLSAKVIAGQVSEALVGRRTDPGDRPAGELVLRAGHRPANGRG